MSMLELYDKSGELETPSQNLPIRSNQNALETKVARHRAWLRTIQRERPNPEIPYRVGVYIRFFNQTKYEDYLAYHKKQLSDTISDYPEWKLVDFYIDEGQSAPNMETAREWSRLVQDCFDGKIDLIITQKVSNVTKKLSEIILLSRLLAAQKPPIGIYFISEDIFTLASYYQEYLKDVKFLPGPEVELLPDENEERGLNDD